MEIEWDEPPPEVIFKYENFGGKYLDLAVALKADPGRWAKLPQGSVERTPASAKGLAQSIRNGKTKGFVPPGAFEAVADGSTVWARYKVEQPQRPPAGAGNGSDDDPPADPPEPEGALDTSAVRAWAREQGSWPQLGERGRLPSDLVEAYKAAHAPDDD